MTNFKTKLGYLVSSGAINEEKYKKFLLRGIQFEKFDSDFPYLKKYFPRWVPIGASEIFINNLDVPYQETSYVCASTGTKKPRTYLYKTDNKHGGVVDLLGGKRPLGDTLFASLSRILLGNKAIMFSADNLIENSNQVWNWNFFGKYLKNDHQDIFNELKLLAEKKSANNPIQVILARKKSTFERLNFIKKYQNNEIAIFNSKNKIVFLTDDEGFRHVSKKIKPDQRIQYITETNESGEIDIKKCMQVLRKKFGVEIMLNDGGRKMSLGLKKLKLLGGERVSYEPFPGEKFIPKIIREDLIFGEDGMGIDGSPISDSIVAFEHKFDIDKSELLKLHLYSI
jgi:hypothetical protein